MYHFFAELFSIGYPGAAGTAMWPWFRGTGKQGGSLTLSMDVCLCACIWAAPSAIHVALRSKIIVQVWYKMCIIVETEIMAIVPALSIAHADGSSG